VLRVKIKIKKKFILPNAKKKKQNKTKQIAGHMKVLLKEFI